MAESTLVALRVESRERAHELYHDIEDLAQNTEGLHIIDAACVYKTDNDSLRIDQTRDVKGGEGLLGGGLIGIIVGAMVAGPVGVAIGALTGGVLSGLYTGLRDSGMNNEVIEYAGRDLLPGQAALLVLYEGTDHTAYLDQLRGYDAQMIYSTLPTGARDQIETALGGVNYVPARSLDVDVPPLREEAPVSTSSVNVQTAGVFSGVNAGALPGATAAAAAIAAEPPRPQDRDDRLDAINEEYDAIHDTGAGDLPEPHMSDDAYIADNARTDGEPRSREDQLDSREAVEEPNMGIRTYPAPADTSTRETRRDNDSAMPTDRDLGL